MKKMQVVMLAMLVALVPGIASGISIAFDFTGGGSAWTIVGQSGLPDYPATFELDGDSTKVGYTQNADFAAHISMWQQVILPVGATNVQLSANVSGYSSWVMLGRIGLSTVATSVIPSGTYWTGIDHLPTGVSYYDEPVSISDTFEIFDGTTDCYVGIEVHKGLSWVYQRPDVSQVVLTYDVIPEPSSIAPVVFVALAFMKRR